MKHTSILAATIGAAAVLGAGGTALAATTGDDHGDATASPAPIAAAGGALSGGAAPDAAVSGGAVSGGAVSGGAVSGGAVSGFGDAGSAGAVSATDAEGLALAATGGGRVIRVEAETEHGVAVWSVRIVVNGVRHDIDVDRGTGRVRPHGHGADDGAKGDAGR
jgi:uncharacterized membrane protein YkoI